MSIFFFFSNKRQVIKTQCASTGMIREVSQNENLEFSLVAYLKEILDKGYFF